MLISLDDDCGCKTGARFAVLGLVLASVWYWVGGHAAALSTGAVVLRVLLTVVMASGVGKVIGILLARAASGMRAPGPGSAEHERASRDDHHHRIARQAIPTKRPVSGA